VVAQSPPSVSPDLLRLLADGERLRAERARRSLRHFVREAWHVVEPGTPFVSGWHLDCVCEHLEAVSRGEIRNLLLNFPPRHMKSLAVSVFWPMWTWIDHPAKRWLFASYGQDLAIRDSVKCRNVIQSPWYRRHFGDRFQLTKDQNQKTRFENDKTGFRIATSVDGMGTGEGGDFIVADDPHNVKETESDAVRDEVLRWWDETISTRGNDPKTVAKVIVMQRIHERDLSGHVLAKGGYHHLCLPAEYEPRVFVKPGEIAPKGLPQPHDDCHIATDPRTKAGELLWPNRFGPAELEALKLDLNSSYAVAGQLQQRPVPRAGATFNVADIKPLPANFAQLRPHLSVVQFYDLAWSERDSADYTAGITIGLDPRTQDLYILHVWRQRVGEDNLDETLADQIAQHRPGLVGVELGAFKQAATKDLVRRLNRLLSERKVATVVTAVPVSTDKGFRAQVPAGRAKAGFVSADKTAPWWQPFSSELSLFPKGANDDQVDAFSGGVQLAIERGRPRSRDGVQMLFGGGDAPQPDPGKPDSPAAYLAQMEAAGWPGAPPETPIRLPRGD
jgi:predicted phage terminase large subunit-like protein